MLLPALALACGGGPGGRNSGSGPGLVTLGQDDDGPLTDGETDPEQATEGHGGTGQSGTTEGSADEGSGNDPKFDLGQQPDAQPGGCGGGGGGDGGDPDFSYIWITNSNEGTVSKIDTQTMVELGRYIVRPDANGNPSRTSVNLNGDVVIANRSGGITKIYARAEDCPNPANTSTGPGDVKVWPDGCVAWHTPMAYASQRPVAWTQGTFDEGSCRYEDTKVWTSGANATIDVLLVDGETGMIEQTVPIPGVNPSFYGIYGGAVDAAGNFWGSQLGQGQLVRVRLADMGVSTWGMPASGYGMTVDSQGNVWTCANTVARFDPMTQVWQTATVGGGGGCMEDGNGTLWLANDPMVGIDINTMGVVQSIDLPNYVHGISIDFYGYVWGPAIFDDEAYRVD
ncbi:MAG: hypothetical protein AB1Z98_15700, partial [Nannocystaceae bacterium]